MKLKSILWATCLCLSSALFYACHNDENAPPLIEYPGCDPTDVTSLKHILSSCGIDIADSVEYNGLLWYHTYQTRWESIPGSPQGKRLVSLCLVMTEDSQNPAVAVPVALNNLPYLRTLAITGREFSGDFPDIHNLPIDTLIITKTGLTSLPDNLFTARMKYVMVNFNRFITECPTSVRDLQPKRISYDFRPYYLHDNGFTGAVRLKKNIPIDLRFNKFTEINWDDTEGMYFNVSAQDWNERIYLSNLSPQCIPLYTLSYFKGVIPDHILADTLGIVNLFHDTYQSLMNSQVFANMPDYRNVLIPNMKEYISNHPEFIDFTTTK